MRRLHIPIVGLMGLVAVSAIGFAALSDPCPLWASVVFTLALAAVSVAAVGAIACRGPRRVEMLCATLLGGAYLLVAFVLFPTVNGLQPPPLLTRAAVDLVDGWQISRLTPYTSDNQPTGVALLEVHFQPTRPTGPGTVQRTTQVQAERMWTQTPGPGGVSQRWVTLVLMHTRQIVHSLAGIAATILGALLASVLIASSASAEGRRDV